MKYRIKEYEELVTTHKRSLTTGLLEVASERMEKRYQIEMRLKGIGGYLLGWTERGLSFDTEEEARKRVADYKRAEELVSEEQEKGVRYINID